MAITKTNFINYTRCPRYIALDNIKKERLAADLNYEEYQEIEKEEIIQEILGSMYELGENEEEIDLIDKKNIQLEAMLPYYNQIEQEAGKIVEKYFPGKTVYSKETKNQECFDFNRFGLKYLCYVDIYNESNRHINIFEVKATTSKKYLSLLGGYPKSDKFPIFKKSKNIYYLKDEIAGYNLETEMAEEKYTELKNKLFDRYGIGSYVFDLAIQRFIIEGEYKESHNEEKLKDLKYYLAVLNSSYIFSGNYINDKAIYDPDEKGEELIVFFDLTKITEQYQTIIFQEADKLENYLKNLSEKSCPLGNWCGYKKQNCCKFFAPLCGKNIPSSNSSLSYIHNNFGFKKENGERIKGLDLINEGYINLLDVPIEWITNPLHKIQRECYEFNREYVDQEKIKACLNELSYPIYHLDFETFPCPLPRFKGEWPYIQSPFEFSLHIEKEPGKCDFDRDNYIFLAKSFKDEREELIKNLLTYIDGNKGTLIAQNVNFEKGRIKELAHIFPEYKEKLMKIYERGFDLLWIINTKKDLYESLGFDEERAKLFNYYHKLLSGSFSIKKTLPVFSPLSYDKLVVKNGTEAIIEYANYNKMSPEEFKVKYTALQLYCKQDTWAMVVILDALRKIVN